MSNETTVVVLGMHSGGTSLIAGMLDAMGVQMNYNPKLRVKWYTNYEDSGWLRLNDQILKMAGGNWRKAPQPQRVAGLANNKGLQKRIKDLIAQKRSGLWGFKDPRTGLTVSLIHPHLTNPHYIRVTRDHRAVAQDIISRGPPTRSEQSWIALSEEYNKRIDQFLEGLDNGKVLTVALEDLVRDVPTAERETKKMAKFLGLEAGVVDAAVGRIDFAKARQ